MLLLCRCHLCCLFPQCFARAAWTRSVYFEMTFLSWVVLNVQKACKDDTESPCAPYSVSPVVISHVTTHSAVITAQAQPRPEQPLNPGLDSPVSFSPGSVPGSHPGQSAAVSKRFICTVALCLQ